MASTTETLWAVYTNSDLTEGRGRQYVKHFCRTQATALRLAKRGYVQGLDCPVEPVETLLLDGKHVLPASLLRIEEPDASDIALEKRLEISRAALARAKAAGLSNEDIAALREVSP